MDRIRELMDEVASELAKLLIEKHPYQIPENKFIFREYTRAIETGILLRAKEQYKRLQCEEPGKHR